MITISIPTNTRETRNRDVIIAKGNDVDKARAKRAWAAILGGGAAMSASELAVKALPIANPQAPTLKHNLLPVGIALGMYGAGAGLTHAAIHSDDKKEVAKGLGVAGLATGLGVGLYQANKAFIESGRYPGVNYPWVARLGMLGTAALPVAAYHLFKNRRRLEGDDRPLVELIKQKVRDM